MVHEQCFHKHTVFGDEIISGLKPDLVSTLGGRKRIIDIVICGEKYTDEHCQKKVVKYFNLCG